MENINKMILKYPDPILNEDCKKCAWYPTMAILELHRNLIKIGTVGLAAPQVGYPLRVILVMGVPMVNPEILEFGKMLDSKEECLSVDGIYSVPRASDIRVKWLDHNMDTQEDIFFNDLACIIQHEVDHLDGILINKKGKKL